MRTRVDEKLRDEAERFGFRFRCDDCVHFTGTSCVHGFPTEEHRRTLDSPEIVFCKELEIA